MLSDEYGGDKTLSPVIRWCCSAIVTFTVSRRIHTHTCTFFSYIITTIYIYIHPLPMIPSDLRGALNGIANCNNQTSIPISNVYVMCIICLTEAVKKLKLFGEIGIIFKWSTLKPMECRQALWRHRTLFFQERNLPQSNICWSWAPPKQSTPVISNLGRHRMASTNVEYHSVS